MSEKMMTVRTEMTEEERAQLAKGLALPQGAAARSLGITDRTLRRWEKAGLISGNRVTRGSVKLYPVERLLELARGQ